MSTASSPREEEGERKKARKRRRRRWKEGEKAILTGGKRRESKRWIEGGVGLDVIQEGLRGYVEKLERRGGRQEGGLCGMKGDACREEAFGGLR